MAAVHALELLGPPASGKSALASALAARDDVVVVKSHGLGDTAALVASARRAGATYLLPRPPGVRASRQAAWITRLGAAPEVVERRARQGAALVVLDQGPAYTLGRLCYLCQTRRGRDWWGRQALRTAAMLDLVVLLDVQPDALADRLRSRTKTHAARTLEPPEALAYMRAERERSQAIAEVLAGAGTRVLRMDTAALSPDAEVLRVLEALATPLTVTGSAE